MISLLVKSSLPDRASLTCHGCTGAPVLWTGSQDDVSDRLAAARAHVASVHPHELVGFGDLNWATTWRDRGDDKRHLPEVLRDMTAEGASLEEIADYLGVTVESLDKFAREHG